MADYERRPRGGGRGSFQNNRKRRHREDDESDRRPQRRRYEEPLAVTLRKQILYIAESPVRKVEEDVSSIAKSLAENYFDADITSGFLDLVVQLTLEQPLKIPFVSAIVLVLNQKKPDFTAEVLRKVGDAAQTHVEAGNWREVKLFLRFLGCLQGLFEGNGVFALLEVLFSRAVDLQTASSEDSLGLELVKIILYTIAYTMSASEAGSQDDAMQLLDKTDIIASTPHPLESLVDPFYSGLGDEPSETRSALSLLQTHLQDEAKKNWELSCLPRPWKPLAESAEEETSAITQKHPFPTISVPETLQIGPRPIYPDVYFSVYKDQDVETVPPASDITAFLVRDTLTDTINALDFNRNATAKFLIEVDCYFAPNTFVRRATPFDKLRDLAGDRPTWKPEDVAVDAAFSQLFQLPAPEHKLVYYHSVLTEACKIAPAAIAPSLGRAIRFLYRSLDRLDIELAQRFLDWFAHHLSNFGFTWKWTEWIGDIGLLEVHPRKSFMSAALDKEIRLSFAQRIKGTLPEPYHTLIPEAKSKDIPDFKYADETVPFASEGGQIAQLIRRKATDAEISPVLLEMEQAASAQNLDPLLASTDAYVTSICFVGSKSLSHFLSCIERCKERLLSLGPASPTARRQIITSVMEYWHDQPGVGVNIVDKLLNYTIITPASVVEWVLIDHVSQGTILAKNYAYEMISVTMTKVTKRVRQIVQAIRRPGLPAEQTTMLQETLERERGDMQKLFALIEDSMVSLASGTDDAQMESDAMDEEATTGADGDENADGNDETKNALGQQALIRQWGGKWMRVFRRRYAVEESWITEELLKPLPPLPPPRPVDVPDQAVPDATMKLDDPVADGDGGDESAVVAGVNGGAATNGSTPVEMGDGAAGAVTGTGTVREVLVYDGIE